MTKSTVSVPASQPTNTNLALTTRYQLSFTRLPNLMFFVQTFSLPGVNMTEVIRETPFNPTYHAGDKLMYDPIVVTYNLDEDLRTWQSIHDWMRGLTFPTKWDEYRNLKAGKGLPLDVKSGLYSDATLQILTNSQNINLGIKFYNVFPTSMGVIQLNAGEGTSLGILADMTLRFDYFDIIRPEVS